MSKSLRGLLLTVKELGGWKIEDEEDLWMIFFFFFWIRKSKFACGRRD